MTFSHRAVSGITSGVYQNDKNVTEESFHLKKAVI
jgi:hypothetical protein